jgi:hypothetical protein
MKKTAIAYDLIKNNLQHMKNKFLLLGIALASLTAAKRLLRYSLQR